MSKALAKTDTFGALLAQNFKNIKNILPSIINPQRMARLALVAVQRNPKLAACTPESLIGCVLQSAQLGLEVANGLGHAYLVPFRVKGTPTCTLIIGYQGMLELAHRSGYVAHIYAHTVDKADDFDVSLGTDKYLKHRPARKPSGEMTYVYAAVTYLNGTKDFVYLSKEDVDKVKARSRAKNDGPWVTDYEDMAKKTAVRRLFKMMPKSAEIARAVAVDEHAENNLDQTQVYDVEVQEVMSTVPSPDVLAAAEAEFGGE